MKTFDLITFQVTHAPILYVILLGIFVILASYGLAATIADTFAINGKEMSTAKFITLALVSFLGICGALTGFGYHVSHNVIEVAKSPKVEYSKIVRNPNGKLSALAAIPAITKTEETTIKGQKALATVEVQPKQEVYLDDSTIQFLAQSNLNTDQLKFLLHTVSR